ncbi:hypothetical protein MRX96_037467 [Rhipicephalus microplus]
MVEMLYQQAYLRLVMQRPRNIPDHNQVQVTEDCNHLCKLLLSLSLVADDRLYHLMIQQNLLESEMCVVRRITMWSPFDLLHWLPCEQRRTPNAAVIYSPAAHLICQQLPYAKPYQPRLDRPKSILPSGLLREFKDHALSVSSATLKIFSLKQDEPGLRVVEIGLNTLTLCMFHLYAAAVSEACLVFRKREREDV